MDGRVATVRVARRSRRLHGECTAAFGDSAGYLATAGAVAVRECMRWECLPDLAS